MAPQKIAQRKRAMRVADAVNKMEGVPVRCYAIELSNACLYNVGWLVPCNCNS